MKSYLTLFFATLLYVVPLPALELVVARHGLTDWNVERRLQGTSDVPLNELGREQAAALAQQLQQFSFDAAYSSDLSRAEETAMLLLEGRDLPLNLEPRLRELCFGNFEGQLIQEVEQEFVAALLDFELAEQHGMETLQQLKLRVNCSLREIVQQHWDDERVLIVTHSGVIRAMIEATEWQGEGECPVKLFNCEYAIVKIDESGVAITEVGSWEDSLATTTQL